MKARFTDEQIIAIIKEQEAGEKTADVCRRREISSATFCKYKSKYGGMEPSYANRLRALEDENSKLKKLLDNAMLRVSIQKSGDDAAFVRNWSEGNGRMWEAESGGAFDGRSSGQSAAGVASASWRLSTTSAARTWCWSRTHRCLVNALL